MDGHKVVLIVALCSSLFFRPPTPAGAANLVPKARIASITGDASVKYRGTDNFVSVWRRERISAGDTIATGEESSVVLIFGDGNLIALGPSGRLMLETIAPSYAPDPSTGRRKAVVTITARLESGRLRAALGTGSRLGISMGWAALVTNPVTGADFTYAGDVFSLGYYLRVDRGSVFIPGAESRPVPVCAGSAVKVGMTPEMTAPLLLGDQYGHSIYVDFGSEMPSMLTREEPLPEITVNNKKVLSAADDIFHVPASRPEKERPLVVSGKAEPGRAILISLDEGADWVTVLPDDAGTWEFAPEHVPPRELALTVKSFYIGTPPADFEALLGTAPSSSSGAAAPAPEKAPDPDAVAGRFIDAFVGALGRGDTAALSSLISADYNGTIGGGSRAAFLRGVSDFFRAGNTLSIVATPTTASLSGDSIIVTMGFSARAGATTKSGSAKLWLTTNGALTHAEGDAFF